MGLSKSTRAGRRFDGQSYRDMAASIQEIVHEEMDSAASDGEDFARNFIEHAGTGTTWKTPPGFLDRNGGKRRRMQPGEGRVDTGDMRDAISYAIRTGSTIQALVGWIDPATYKPYMGAQDTGFSYAGYRNHEQAVKGMHLIAALRVFMRDRADIAIDNALRRVNDGL